MYMTMVLIRHMRVRMAHRIVAMGVIVGSGRHWVMCMGVMPVVVAVRMLVFDRQMIVDMGMIFGQVQKDPADHQSGARDQPHAAAAIAH